MARSEPVSTVFYTEIAVALKGVYCPYVPMTPPSYSSGGDPPEEAHIEDADIESVILERLVKTRTALPGVPSMVMTEFDILKGLDDAARNIVISNLLEAIGEEQVQEVLCAEASE